MTPRGQTPHPIPTIFNRLLEGAKVDMYPENEVPASKTVDGRVLTDRQTHTQTHKHDRKHDSCSSQMGNYNKSFCRPAYPKKFWLVSGNKAFVFFRPRVVSSGNLPVFSNYREININNYMSTLNPCCSLCS